jgi:hypothetical protein
MSAIYEHPSYRGRISSHATPPPADAPAIETLPDAGLTALATASRSCCCIARPAVIVFMPRGHGREKRAGLLLCMHHYRLSRQKLAACGARVVDESGALLTDRDPWYHPARGN